MLFRSVSVPPTCCAQRSACGRHCIHAHHNMQLPAHFSVARPGFEPQASPVRPRAGSSSSRSSARCVNYGSTRQPVRAKSLKHLPSAHRPQPVPAPTGSIPRSQADWWAPRRSGATQLAQVVPGGYAGRVREQVCSARAAPKRSAQHGAWTVSAEIVRRPIHRFVHGYAGRRMCFCTAPAVLCTVVCLSSCRYDFEKSAPEP